MAKALIIGGGVIGLCTAIRLAERNMTATVVDNPPPLGASSWGNIGHIATEQCAPLASWRNIRSMPRRLFSFGGPVGLPISAMGAWLPFGFRMMKAARKDRYEAGTHALASLLAEALPAWRRLDQLWPQSSVLQDQGHFVIWESSRTAAAGRNDWASAHPGTTRFRDASDAELNMLSRLAPKADLRAIRFENTGKITDLHKLRQNLFERLAALGGTVLDRRAERIAARSRVAEVVFEDGGALAPDLVVVCAGAGSAELLEPLGHAVPLIAERGYHVECDTSQFTPSTPPMVFEDRSVVINCFQHGLRIAGFVEFAQASTPPDSRKWQRLEQHLGQLGIAHAGARRRWMGARPTLPDYLPAIGRSHVATNLLYAFGHQHLGLTLAPLTAEWIARLAFDAPAEWRIGPFSLERFATA